MEPGGLAAIAVWAEIERNQIFAAFHSALTATVPAELAQLITAPFSWHRTEALEAAAKDAGFVDVQLQTRTLPMILEKGLDQAVQSFAATPVSPGVASLPLSQQESFFARLRRELGPLLVDGKVVSAMTSHIVVAYA